MKKQREKTNYSGVYFVWHRNKATGNLEKKFYIRYRCPKGIEHTETVGSSLNGMSPTKAHKIRVSRIEGRTDSNKVRRTKEIEAKEVYKNRWTFERLWEHYYENHNFKNKRRALCLYNKHLKPNFGRKTPEEITPLEIDAFKLSLVKADFSDTSIRNILSTLRILSNWGRKKHISAGLSFMLDMPKGMNFLNEALNPEQITSLLDVLDTSGEELESAFIKTLLFTGRRSGDLCNLRWEDIDLDQQKMNLFSTKTQSLEILPLADEVVRVIRAMPKINQEWVFPNHFNAKRQRSDIKAKRLVRKSKVPQHFRPTYCLRHTFASIAAETIGKDYVIKTLLGHVNPRKDITARYAHVSHPVALKAANEVVAAMLTRPEPKRVGNVIPFVRRENV